MPGLSRSKNGVASLAYDPVVHANSPNIQRRPMDCRVEPGNDGKGASHFC